LDPHGEHTIAKALRQERPWFDPVVSEVRLEAEARDAEHFRLIQGLGFASEIVTPLVARGRNLGSLTLVRSSAERRYTMADLELAEELARRVAIAVDNARLYEAEQQARRNAEETVERIASLQAVTAALSEALTSSQVTQAVIRGGLSILGADGGSITVPDETGDYPRVVDYFGYSSELIEAYQKVPLSPDYGPVSEAICTGQPSFIESPDALFDQYPALKGQKISGHQSWVALPLKVQERILGAITLSFASPRTYSEEERAFLLALAQQCAQALERARLYETEQKARVEAEASQQRLALLAEARERNRLAQELHDTVAQSLGYLNLKIATANSLLASGQIDAASTNLQEAKNVISETYTDVREEIFNLRAKLLSGLGFMELLDRYIDKYRRFYNLDIQLIQEADPALFEFPPEVTPQIVRTIQEALINIRKHAQVNTAFIYLGQEDGYIRIRIEDHGQGFDPAKIKEKTSSFGLQIMRERVEGVGGNLEIDTAPDQGTRIILRYKKN
jgi:signal transduction histidine kinase